MSLDLLDFEKIALPDLEALVENGQREGIGIEYKSQVLLSSDEEKKEFLADLTSFANTKGGFLIIGIDEERDSVGKPSGIPQSVAGVEAENIGHELARLESISRDGIEPRINGLRIKPISTSAGRHAIVIKIPASLISPHIVKYKGASRFYSRNSSGKYPLAYSEIREAFLQSDNRFQKIKAFRADRLAKLVAGEHPISFNSNPMVVMHMLPLVETNVDVIRACNSPINPIYSRSCSVTLNFDGALFYSGDRTYVRFFRNGIIEAVGGNLIRNGEKIPSFSLEEAVLDAANRFLLALETAGVPYPIAFCYSLLGVKGFELGVAPSYGDMPRPFQRNDMIMNEVILESRGNLNQLIKPLFDLVWQEAGWQGSVYFNDKFDLVRPRY